MDKIADTIGRAACVIISGFVPRGSAWLRRDLHCWFRGNYVAPYAARALRFVDGVRRAGVDDGNVQTPQKAHPGRHLS